MPQAPPPAGDDAWLDPRVARSRAVILAAASEHFLHHGYVGTSVDDVAARARVSKRTVYNIFGSKERLFREILDAAFATAERFARQTAALLIDADDLEDALVTAAVRLTRTVMDDRIVRLRRLLIGEAERFPELAREYYRRAPGHVMEVLADTMRLLTERGVLRVDDARLASEHFAFLVMGAPLDRALFTVDDSRPSADELEARATSGVEAFLRAYRDPR
ncbi:MAG TPA: TetR/AcrR family transcriptional regulator [Stackebrandtia sp.]|uniref:TetR/AcrR family transcriptional regulator n=1 Tax=Stackebrandtia sp. TaxID=2023065 RepID=UPI002D4C0376|nr:TetR/AcrR family transcriptional regulator [Stackebrandtia sp.]HZE38680.1 TetR/AcrR family transcriptional regulator [Stackebrandtia sp.]